MTEVFQIHLSVDNLALSRGTEAIVSNLSFDVEPGQAVWLTGANGIGKTSLLLALAGLIPLDKGTIDWHQNGVSVSLPDALAFSAFKGPERDGLNLGEELTFWQRVERDSQTLADRLASVGLTGREDTPVAGLSAGQRRRLALARLLIGDRATWLMDEPFASLDTDGRTLVIETLSTHLGRGGIALIASHQPIAIPGVDARKLVMEVAR